MRIAQVAPLFESVPPQLYGGTERVVSYLTEELVRLGHDVTLFASGDSLTSARLIRCCERSLRLDPAALDHLAHQVLMLEEVAKRAAHFDVVHYHIDYFHYPLSRRQSVPQPSLRTRYGTSTCRASRTAMYSGRRFVRARRVEISSVPPTDKVRVHLMAFNLAVAAYSSTTPSS